MSLPNILTSQQVAFTYDVAFWSSLAEKQKLKINDGFGLASVLDMHVSVIRCQFIMHGDNSLRNCYVSCQTHVNIKHDLSTVTQPERRTI